MDEGVILRAVHEAVGGGCISVAGGMFSEGRRESRWEGNLHPFAGRHLGGMREKERWSCSEQLRGVNLEI